MTAPGALVVAGPGTNRDRDLALAFELAGASPTTVLVDELVERPELLRTARLLGIAGLLWGAGDLAILMIDIGHDVRAARILIGRQAAHHLAEHHAEPHHRAGEPVARK